MYKIIVRSGNWLRLKSTNCAPATPNASIICVKHNPFVKGSSKAQSRCLLQLQRSNSIPTAQINKKSCEQRRSMSNDTTLSSPQPPKHTNRLAQEKSPYLLQHAHNPVDWYPWCDEAIQRARQENKLIFLSVGYSTCHWCHVMERESFENESVARLMNENFVNIKVDREERPDIDKIYMHFLLMMNGSGGWPMSVWLTPDLTPITAGTYFPPQDRWGMPSFATVLKAITEKWKADERDLRESGLKVIESIRKSMSEKTPESTFETGSADAKLLEALAIFKQRYDQEFGGFGTHPKFPEVSRLNFLLHAYIVRKDIDVLDMSLQTLRKIGNGGIYDHVFGGFARYSVDRAWHVPHFEKMLYDQGQLMAAYANAYKLTRDDYFLRLADGIFRYITKDLQHPSGGFYAGEDADSLPDATSTNKVEGAFYAWTAEEIRAEIAAASYPLEFDEEQVFKIYSYHYDVRSTGNVDPSSDPYGHLRAKNILIVRMSEENTCAKFGLTAARLREILRITNDALHQRRDKRPRPHLDTKIITSWNGLVLSGLSKLANCCVDNNERRAEYMQAARKLLDFLRTHHYDAERQQLLRSSYGVAAGNSALEFVPGQQIDGFLDDYAFLIKGLHDYYKASLDADALLWSKQLQDVQDKLFWDETNGAYFFSQADSPHVLVRLKSDHDGAEPCGNSVAARNLILLSHYFDDESYRRRACKLLEFFADEQPFGYMLPEMMCSLLLNEHGLDLVAVVGPDTQLTKRFVELCRMYYIPGMIILHVDPSRSDNELYNERLQQKYKMIKGKPTVYICHEKMCRMPVTDPEKLEEYLTQHFLFKSQD